MVTRIATALGRLATGASSAALGALGKLGAYAPSEAQIAELLERAAEQFEAIEVVVTCRPTGPKVDDYALEVDLGAFESALKAGRIVQPKIKVIAATSNLDRSLLTERLIETFAVVLVEHQARMEAVKERREQRLAREASETTSTLLGGLVGFFVDAALLAMVGLGALVGPLFWLMIAFGGIIVLKELPSVAFAVLKRAVGFGGDADETELMRLKAELARYEPLLLRMVTAATITEEPVLRAAQEQY